MAYDILNYNILYNPPSIPQLVFVKKSLSVKYHKVFLQILHNNFDQWGLNVFI